MKKIILAVALIFSAGILSSQTKTNRAQPTLLYTQKFSISNNLKNLASAD